MPSRYCPGTTDGQLNLQHYFVQFACGDVEDEAQDGVFVWDEGAGLDAGDRLPDVFIEVGECFGGPWWLDAGVVLDGALELVVGERQPSLCGG
jgi:hypothetical protein